MSLKAFANKHAGDENPFIHLTRVSMAHKAGVSAIAAAKHADKAGKSIKHDIAAKMYAAASKEMAAISEHQDTHALHKPIWKSRSEAHSVAADLHQSKAKELAAYEASQERSSGSDAKKVRD